MSHKISEIANQLLTASREEGKKFRKTQLIYAFNGTGKTRLSRLFKEIVDPKEARAEGSKTKIIYYNAFTEDLFYWDNDLQGDKNRKLLVQPNGFTEIALNFLKDESQDGNIITNFQNYTRRSITPKLNEDFSEITFDYYGGGDDSDTNIKISKGEESNFIWCVFYSLIEHIVKLLNESEADRSSDKFNELEYIFIDDPVSSLDDNHLIDLAVDLSHLIKAAKQTNIKFIVSTHNPLFYNVLFNELNRQKHVGRYLLQKLNDGNYLITDCNDSPFSYHIFLLDELKSAAISKNIHKFHFNLLRNVLEKTSTYLGYNHWEDLIPLYVSAEEVPIAIRLINLYSHSKHSGDEMALVQENEKDSFVSVFNKFLEIHSFKLHNTTTQVGELAQQEQQQDVAV